MAQIQNVLLIDDDETNNFVVQHLLKKNELAGCIHISNNGEDGLKKVHELFEKSIDLDLILLDINMPIMDGFEFLEVYQELPEAYHAQKAVLMVSSALMPRDLERIKAYSCLDRFVEKPITSDIIEAIISNSED